MPLSLSLLLHGALAGLAVFGVMHSHSGDSWGGPGGSVTVGLVGNVPAIPLPHPDVSTSSRVPVPLVARYSPRSRRATPRSSSPQARLSALARTC